MNYLRTQKYESTLKQFWFKKRHKLKLQLNQIKRN